MSDTKQESDNSAIREGLAKTITLNNSNIEMPLFGLGTWLAADGGEAKTATLAALDCGYRLIDTAAYYENEEDIGKAVSESGLDRKDVFITTKLHWEHHDDAKIQDEVKESCTRLGLDFVDLFLIHSPRGGNVINVWKALIQAKADGLTRSIGVSNFGVKHLQAMKDEGLELPDVNQIELHPWLQQTETVEWCKANGVAVMGYCPLARCKQFGQTDLKDIATSLAKSEADICIRWSLENEYVTIPKSSKPARVVSNANAVRWELGQETLQQMKGLDCGFKASSSVNAMDEPWDDVK